MPAEAVDPLVGAAALLIWDATRGEEETMTNTMHFGWSAAPVVSSTTRLRYRGGAIDHRALLRPREVGVD